MSVDTNRKAVAWSLKPTPQQPAESNLPIGPGAEHPAIEGALTDDTRKPVNLMDIKPGGKYYSIVKLQIRYEKQGPDDNRWAQGSGWLIGPDVLITAGHCAFDHTYKLGRAAEIKAYVGYNGKDSIGTSGVQFRHGARVITTFGWHQSDVNRHNDVSFVRLDRPFNNITPFKWAPTPTSGKLKIGVVGYPADKTYRDEHAAQMYEMYKEVTFDLNLSQLNMLEYTISSYGGQSGSPVVIHGSSTAIGTHVYGLGDKNSASVIRGTYGNHYQLFQNAISKEVPAYVEGQGPSVVDFPATEDAMTSSGAEFNFLSILGTALNVGTKLLGRGESVMEQKEGVPSAAVASAAMAYAAKRAESGQTTESSLNVSTGYKGVTYNAIAGEAALETILKMPKALADKYNITEQLRQDYAANHPHIKEMARAIRPAILEHLASTALNPIAAGTDQYPRTPKLPGAESTLEESQPLVRALANTAQARGETEGFMDFLKVVGTQVIKAAPTVLNVAAQVVKSVRQESTLEPLVTESTGLQPQIECLCQRAVIANSALKVLNKLPPHVLQQEGFFDGFVATVKNIGSHVVKAMPGVIRAVEPVIHQAIQAHFNPPPTPGMRSGLGESAFKNTGFAPDRGQYSGDNLSHPGGEEFSFGDFVNFAGKAAGVGVKVTSPPPPSSSPSPLPPSPAPPPPPPSTAAAAAAAAPSDAGVRHRSGEQEPLPPQLDGLLFFDEGGRPASPPKGIRPH